MRYNADKLIELAHWMLPEDRTLEEDVRFSIQNPAIYFKYYKQKRSYWKGFRKPTSLLPWFALMDGLYDRQLLFEFNDFDLTQKNSFSHPPTPLKAKRWAWVIKEGRWNAEYRWDAHQQANEYKKLFIEITGKYLDQLGYVLCEFAPSYHPITMTILDKEIVEPCRQLALQSGYGTLLIHRYQGTSSHQTLKTSHSILPTCLYPLPQEETLWKV